MHVAPPASPRQQALLLASTTGGTQKCQTDPGKWMQQKVAQIIACTDYCTRWAARRSTRQQPINSAACKAQHPDKHVTCCHWVQQDDSSSPAAAGGMVCALQTKARLIKPFTTLHTNSSQFPAPQPAVPTQSRTCRFTHRANDGTHVLGSWCTAADWKGRSFTVDGGVSSCTHSSWPSLRPPLAYSCCLPTPATSGHHNEKTRPVPVAAAYAAAHSVLVPQTAAQLRPQQALPRNPTTHAAVTDMPHTSAPAHTRRPPHKHKLRCQHTAYANIQHSIYNIQSQSNKRRATYIHQRTISDSTTYVIGPRKR
jgi:hypothetical protein